MRLIDADAEILKIEAEIERCKERIEQWNDSRTDRNLYDVDLKIRELERNILDCKIEIKLLRQYTTVDTEAHDKEIRDKAIEEFTEEAMKQFTEFDLKHGYPTVTDCKTILREIAEQMKEVGERTLKKVKDVY